MNSTHRTPMAFLVVGIMALSLAASTAGRAAPPMEDTPHVVLTPATMEWVPAGVLPPGAELAVIEGDPSKEGFFALRLKLPANYRIPPHHHPAPERVTVLEGTFSLGQGETFDANGLTAYMPGSYLSMPVGMRHFAATGDEEVIIQLASIGPWGITYVNPEDDPRTQPAAQ